MKNILPALNKLQIACQDKTAPLTDIGKARKELFAAIRQTLVEGMNISCNQPLAAGHEFLAKFDKLNGD